MEIVREVSYYMFFVEVILSFGIQFLIEFII